MHGIWAYFLMRMKVKLSYRLDFFLSSLGTMTAIGVGLAMVLTIFSHVPEVAGWTVYEVLLCWGFTEASLGLFWMVFQGLYHANRQYVLGGDLDRVLLRPIDPYLQILLDHVNVEAIPPLLMGIGVIVVGAWGTVTPLGWIPWLALPVFVISGAAIIGGVLTAISALGFWMQHQGSAIGLAYQFTGYGKYPLDFYPWPIALVFATVLPFAFTGFFPATLFMDRPEWWAFAALQPLVGLGCIGAGYTFWRYSMRRYSSSGT